MFSYLCPQCGLIDSPHPGDQVQCRCGHTAKRRFQVSINRTSLRQTSRWDPVVGAYVENDRQFKTLLRQGQDEQAEKLGMDVKLETVDARDHDALNSLHGTNADERKHESEKAKRVRAS